MHEFGWLSLPIPQWSRQTSNGWYTRFGPIGAAWWWGIDLGSGLTTLITFSGYWLLVLAVFANGIPIYGGIVLGLYGLGRALPVGISPLLIQRKDWNSRVSLRLLLRYRPNLHRWHGYGLFGLALGLALRGLILH